MWNAGRKTHTHTSLTAQKVHGGSGLRRRLGRRESTSRAQPPRRSSATTSAWSFEVAGFLAPLPISASSGAEEVLAGLASAAG